MKDITQLAYSASPPPTPSSSRWVDYPPIRLGPPLQILITEIHI
jgi:hypothetical protein